MIIFHSKTPARSESYLIQKYLKEGLSSPDIAHSLNVSKTFVLDQLRKFNIPRRTSKKEQLKVKMPTVSVPYGKKLIDGQLIDFIKEQKIISKIKELHSKEKNVTTIANHLNVLSLPTKKGGKWYHPTIKRILEREGLITNELKQKKEENGAHCSC